MNRDLGFAFTTTLAFTPNIQVRPGLPARRTSSGDHTVVETPVPIPNTVVKHSGPMIVRALAKVGIASFFQDPQGNLPLGVLLFLRIVGPLGRSSKRFFFVVRDVGLIGRNFWRDFLF